jgi:eukaryotic-like serine/threonine-protein kinase
VARADWSRVKDLLEEALGSPPAERGSLLARRCGADEELRREVETLLAAHEQAGGFLEAPAYVFTPETPSPIGRRLGPYRLLAEIGAGGMGTVYRAVREDDAFRREVALKLVRSHAGAAPSTGRFQRERQILARLQHPNIAVLHDGGATEEGQPYLVMELVQGEPLDLYCTARRLPPRDRIALFRQVCGAVHYAHQTLVVHRDLKPGNILVTADGVPKLLDFGIAKLLSPDEGAEALPTATLLPVLTPEFASPEQVKGLPVTTSCDVYALGVVLYLLLTGKRPYEIATRSLEEVARVVCGVEPTRPSLAVASPSPTLAPPATGRELAGDLDTIILKCLQKDPARRYASAQELSEDLRRYLEGRPVLARPDTLGYRAAKFALRHRLAVAAGAVAALSLLVGSVVALRQAHIAEVNRERAERRFEDVRKLAGSLLFDLHDEIVNLPGSLRARQALVTKAEEYLERLAQDAQGDRELQRELAAAYERLGDIHGGARTASLGDAEAALRSYEKALATREALGRTPASEPDDVLALARLRFGMGVLYRTRVDLPEAEAAFADAASLIGSLLAASRTTEDLRGRLAGIHQRLSELQARQGKAALAEASAARAVELAEAFAKDHAKDAEARSNLATAYYAHAEQLAGRDELERALLRLAEARALQEALRAEQPLNTQHARSLAFTLNAEGRYHESRGETKEAVRSYEQQLALSTDLARADPKDQFGRLAVAVSSRSLGWALVLAGKKADGIARLRAARASMAGLLREDPKNGFAREEVTAGDYYLGKALLQSSLPQDRALACPSLRRALLAWEDDEAAHRLDASAAAALPEVRGLVARCPS